MVVKCPIIIINNNNNNKKRTYRIVNFAVSAKDGVELKESEKKDKYLDLARELKKKLRNRKVTVIPIMTGTLGTITKGLVLGPGDLEIIRWVETIQTTALLRSATRQSDGEVPVMLELLGNAEYPFIAIAPRSTLDETDYISHSTNHIYQPLRSGRIWHKVIFKRRFNRLEFRVFRLLD